MSEHRTGCHYGCAQSSHVRGGSKGVQAKRHQLSRNHRRHGTEFALPESGTQNESRQKAMRYVMNECKGHRRRDRGMAFANSRMPTLVDSLFSALWLTRNVKAQELMAAARIVTCAGLPAEIGAAFWCEGLSEAGVMLVDIVDRIDTAELPPGTYAVHLHKTEPMPAVLGGGAWRPRSPFKPSSRWHPPFHAGDWINCRWEKTEAELC